MLTCDFVYLLMQTFAQRKLKEHWNLAEWMTQCELHAWLIAD